MYIGENISVCMSIILLLTYILRYSHREAMSQSFKGKRVLANQRSERYFSYVKKMIGPIRIAYDDFSRMRRRYVQSEATVVCEFRAKIPAFYRRLKLTAPSLLELPHRYSTRKVFLQRHSKGDWL